MSSVPAISVRNLSKCYKLGTIGRHTLVDEIQHYWHKLRGRDPGQHMGKIGHTATEARKVEAEREGNEEFWALKDVSFDVHPGEVVGVIGRNGAGKSTLLKILTRITEPTSGEAFINGRVASLLEVGTGFHPELTGRENIYMNGTILGMKKREIDAKFDEIVAFSELEKFIDTPVKRYSSGMYVRLAFAVAAHLDPQILLVDEVLAVGDAAFQKKCLGKMGDVARQGRTILFVSHNMAAVTTLCPRCVFLHNGAKRVDGISAEVIQQYYDVVADVDELTNRVVGDDAVQFSAARITDKNGAVCRSVSIHDSFAIEFEYRVLKAMDGIAVPNVHVYTASGVCCFVSSAPGLKPANKGYYRARCLIDGNTLNEGVFSFGLAVTTYQQDGRYHVNFFEDKLLSITVVDTKVRDERNYGFVHTVPGILRPLLDWNIERTGE